MMQIQQELKSFILQHCLPGEDPSLLHEHFDLIESGVLDSLALVQLLGYLEQAYELQLQPEEITAEHFATLATISALIERKQPTQGECDA